MWGWDRKIHPEDHRLASRACWVMTNGDRVGWIFLYHPHTNRGCFFLLTNKYLIFIGKTGIRLSNNPKYAEMRHGDVILTLQWSHGSMCYQSTAGRFLSFPRAGKGMRYNFLIWVKTTEISIWCERNTLLTQVKSPGLKVIKLFMFNSAEHEIYPAHKCKNANNCWHFCIH